MFMMLSKRLIPFFLIIVMGILQLGSIVKNKDTANTTSFENYNQKLSGTTVTIPMVAIKGGTYYQGSLLTEKGRNEDEGPKHQVEVPDFWMGAFEITWDQYNLFAQREIDGFTNSAIKGSEINLAVDGVSSATTPYVDMSFGMGKVGYPAINITQYAASVFCQWLSATTGNFYRLPTEAEWEYACRAGTETAYHFGNDPDQLDEYAWYYENSADKYHKVGQKKPNAWGLFDMHGNIAEWTLDQYDPDFYKGFKNKISNNDWKVPNALYPRTVRGGSWYDDPEKLRAAARKPSNPKWKQRDPQIPKSLWWLTNAPFVGFRVVRPYKTPTKEVMAKYWVKPIKDL